MTAVVRATIVGVAALVLLTGCKPPAPVPTTGAPAAKPTVTASATPTSTPTAASDPTMPALAGQELLTISATATAGGAALDVAMTVYYPVTAASAEGQQIAAYLAFKGNTSDVANPDFIASHGAVYQLSRLTVSGTAFPAGSGVLPSLGPGKTDTIVDTPASAVVGKRLSITGPGNGYGVAALYSADSTPSDPAGWADRFTYYGFQDGFAGATLSNCSIQKTALALQSPQVANWHDLNCFTGQGD
ncbi:hypothetical protein BH11ACT4_BH11ACT4_25640 [soil metagenome]